MNRSMVRPVLVLAAVLFVLGSVNRTLTAQEPPRDGLPGLTLPDLTEEVRALENRDMAAPGPELPPLAPPAVAPPLPEEAELAIPAAAYETEAVLDTKARPGLGETFSEVSAGAELWDGVSASLSVYRPGADPAFSMAFSHESRDGFAFHEPGAGYVFRKTDVRGRIRGGSADSGLWSGSISFSDQADGLQGKSQDFYGIAHRYLEAETSYRRPLGPVGATVELHAGTAALSLERGRSYSAGDTGVQELSLLPALVLAGTVRGMDLRLRTAYAFYGLLGDPALVAPADRYSSRGSAALAASFEYSPALSFGASAGADIDGQLAFAFPFSLWTSAALGTSAAIRLEGGLAAENRSLAVAWRQNPYLDIGAVQQPDERWFATGALDVYPRDDLVLSLGADWADSRGTGGRLVPTVLDATRSLYAYNFEAYQTLTGSVALGKRFGATAIRIAWRSDWLDAPVYGERQSLSAGIEYRDWRERYGADLTGSVGFDQDGWALPVVDANAFLRLGSGARLRAEVLDLAAAFAGDTGRELWDPYTAQGFQASLRLQFSL